MSCRQCLRVNVCDEKDRVIKSGALCTAYATGAPGNKVALERGVAKGKCRECGFSPKGRPWFKYNVVSLECPKCGAGIEIVRG